MWNIYQLDTCFDVLNYQWQEIYVYLVHKLSFYYLSRTLSAFCLVLFLTWDPWMRLLSHNISEVLFSFIFFLNGHISEIIVIYKFHGVGMFLMQVQILADNLDIGNANSVNLRSALSAALLLLPSKFTQVCFHVISHSF